MKLLFCVKKTKRLEADIQTIQIKTDISSSSKESIVSRKALNLIRYMGNCGCLIDFQNNIKSKSNEFPLIKREVLPLLKLADFAIDNFPGKNVQEIQQQIIKDKLGTT